jgi:hypothetical protein
MPPDTKHFDELEAVLARSFLARVLMSAAERGQSAFLNSVVMSTIAELRRQFVTLSLADRLRAIGALIVSFGVTEAVLMAMVPVASAPAVPLSVWLVVAAGGASLLAGADAFAAAWPHRSVRKRTRT